MKSTIYDRKKEKEYVEKSPKAADFLYKGLIGAVILGIIIQKPISKLGGRYMDSKLSKRRISKFIRKNKLDMSDYPKEKYQSFNDFFTRKILPGKRPFSTSKDAFMSVADSKLLVYSIDKKTEMTIKGKQYTVSELLRDSKLAKEYQNGYCLVFRLTVDDYHRYSFFDDGIVKKTKQINGVFHTVGPIAFRKYKVFRENQREYAILDTKHFGECVYMEVGALMVGKIKNHDIKEFKKGDEKGYFLFGGSTIIILVKENTITIDKDILKRSQEEIETKVKLGETIAFKK